MPLDQPDIRELKAIIDWVNLTPDVQELSLKYGDVELFVSRGGQGHIATSRKPTTPATSPAPPAAPPAREATAPVPSAPAPAPPTIAAPGDVVITAPMVGTFYAAPSPAAPAFVSVGGRVTPTTVVGIVEVMKLMNSIEAGVLGTVTRIMATNEQAVEFGQPLLVITPDV
ncbi:acetyl-CoA carboxylase biotin carboxyl carrier protein [Microbacterium lacus]|uniref:Biotin carboxyl carrier protein of acetyl-CoA carboxylase n=1 Tax=Microbacterium lacus TaxID=415217 RepID=A0ABP4TE82_9MICO